MDQNQTSSKTSALVHVSDPEPVALTRAIDSRPTKVDHKPIAVTFNEEKHKYYIDGIEMRRSVTQLVHTYFNEFDSHKVAARMLAKDEFRTASKYANYRAIVQDVDVRSEEARNLIIKEWDRVRDEAAAAGTAMHKSIETYYESARLGRQTRPRLAPGLEVAWHGRGWRPEPMTKEFQMFLEFDALTRKLGYLPYRSEQTVFDRGLSLAGSVDMLYIHRDHLTTYPTKVWMVDWKRSKEIKMTGFGGAVGKWPFEDLPDCNFRHYSLQLNLYKYLLEKNEGMQVERMTLVILHPNQSEYIMLDVSDLQDRVKLALER